MNDERRNPWPPCSLPDVASEPAGVAGNIATAVVRQAFDGDRHAIDSVEPTSNSALGDNAWSSGPVTCASVMLNTLAASPASRIEAMSSAHNPGDHALDVAQKLSHQLVAAEQRIADLEAEVERHRDRAERAEQWLHKVYAEIEERFRPPRTMAR